mmetsp:Transcript_5116/g.6806  ORF Transcript_5116/g.6806 Transcript_5116/m.6806 type:complete len:143 (+) Transcript_5116:861-1289(+)
MTIGKPPFETSEIKQTYKRIRAIQYSFPDNVPISDQAKDLIMRILVLDPTKRPTIDEILDHPFFHMGNKIPRLLPPSTLACPPSSAFMKQFQFAVGQAPLPSYLRNNASSHQLQQTPQATNHLRLSTGKTILASTPNLAAGS